MPRIKNWSKFQHFKDRRPPWVKLYRELLDDIEWHELDPKAAKVLVMLWLIASEDSGNLPDTKQLAFRLRMSERETKSVLASLSHWMEQDDISVISGRYQDVPVADTPNTATVEFGVGETETETETYKEEKEKRQSSASRGSRLPSDWVCPSEWVDEAILLRPHWDAAKVSFVADSFRDYWVSVVGARGVKADWLAVWRNWVRNQREDQPKVNGYKSERQMRDDAFFAALRTPVSGGDFLELEVQP